VDYILRFIEQNRRYASFLKWASCSDEIFFTTIVKQSPFSEKITQDFESMRDLTEYCLRNDHGAHYIDWQTKGVPLPKVLELDDLDNLLKSEALFARKFDERRSEALLARLEDLLRGWGE